MNLFTPDLFRNFAFGFVAGGLLIGATTFDQWATMIEAPAQAASPAEVPAPDSAFVIAPLDAGQ